MVVDSSRYEDDYSDAQVFTNVIDTIISPNYPDNYDNNVHKRYVIIAPTRREIMLIFNDFDVENEKNCNWDSLSASILTY